MIATAHRTGIPGERRKAFVAQLLRGDRRLLLAGQQADFVEGHAQVGVNALFRRAQVASCVQLMAGDAVRFLSITVQADHPGSAAEDQQAQQQDVQGFMPGACRTDDVSGRCAHGAWISA